jgi:hypothetical protein
VRVHRLYQEIVNLAEVGVVHQRLFGRFRDHNNRQRRVHGFKLVQRLDAVHPHHYLVQQDGVEGALLHQRHGVRAVGERRHAVTAILQELDLRFQEVDLVVDPQDFGASFLVHITACLPVLL